MPTHSREFKIIAGPSEMALMMSLFARSRDNQMVEFTLEPVDANDAMLWSDASVEMRFTINGLEYKRGDDLDQWTFKNTTSTDFGAISGTYFHKNRIGIATITLKTQACPCGAIWPYGRFRYELDDNCPHCDPDEWSRWIILGPNVRPFDIVDKHGPNLTLVGDDQ